MTDAVLGIDVSKNTFDAPGSVFNMTKQVMDGMVDRGWGRVVNVSSLNGSKGAFGQTNYSAAKAGMHGFTKALALEVAHKGVTVNTISPGYIGTKMVMAIPKEVLDTKILPQIPLGRLGAPEEIAGLIISAPSLPSRGRPHDSGGDYGCDKGSWRGVIGGAFVARSHLRQAFDFPLHRGMMELAV